MIRKIGVLLCVLTLLVVGTALADTPKMGGTLVFGRGGDSVGLDPAYETDGNSFLVCDNIYEALVFYKDESTALEPGLASSWDISEDGKTYTFHLRKGVKFHDGSTLDANDVVRSWEAGMNAASEYHIGNTGAFEYPSYLFDSLMNAE